MWKNHSLVYSTKLCRCPPDTQLSKKDGAVSKAQAPPPPGAHTLLGSGGTEIEPHGKVLEEDRGTGSRAWWGFKHTWGHGEPGRWLPTLWGVAGLFWPSWMYCRLGVEQLDTEVVFL